MTAEAGLWGLTRQAARVQPRALALRADGRTWTFDALARAAAGVAATLAARGVEPGDRVLLRVPNGAPFVLGLLGAAARGAAVVPLPAASTPAEVAAAVRLTAPRLAIIEADAAIDGDVLPSLSDGAVLASAPADPEDWADAPGADALLHFTSGSTGRRRVAIRTWAALAAEGLCYRGALDLTPRDRLLASLPLQHSFALGLCVAGAFAAGACLVVPAPRPTRVARAAAAHAITVLPLVPALVRLLLLARGQPLPSVRWALVGTGPVSADEVARFESRYDVPLAATYGSTETGGLVVRPSATGERQRTCGMPMPGVGVRIRAADGGDCPPGVIGEVWASSPGMLRAYLGEAETPARDGFLPMGDLGYLDAAGALAITGRARLLINRGGRKISPTELEDALRAHPAVADIAVFGAPTSRGEEVVKAAVVLRPGATVVASELRRWCADRLSPHAVPDLVEYWPRLPRDGVGKLARARLLEGRLG